MPSGETSSWNGARDIDALYSGHPPAELQALAQAARDFSLRKEDFLAVIDGMEMDAAQDIRAPDWATLDLYCDRVASAVGRLSVRVFGMNEPDGIALAHHLGRALQLTNILRDLDEDAEIGRLYLPQEALREAGITGTDPKIVLASPGLAQVCDAVAARALGHFQESDAIMARNPRRAVKAPQDHGRGLSRHAARHGGARLGSAANARPGERAAPVVDRLAVRIHLMARTVHIIGAGLAGLAAAVRLAESPAKVVVHEATAYPGGRCRSYFDRTIGMTIDNGNHLVLSGNHDVLGFAQAIGSASGLVGPATAEFPFVDLKSNERWTLRINDGLPWWIFDASRRVPGTRLGEYLRLARLLWVPGDAAVEQVIDCSGPLYDRLVHPLLLAALNIEPRVGSAALASAVVRETLLRGGKACRPLIARDGLGNRVHRAGDEASARTQRRRAAGA